MKSETAGILGVLVGMCIMLLICFFTLVNSNNKNKPAATLLLSGAIEEDRPIITTWYEENLRRELQIIFSTKEYGKNIFVKYLKETVDGISYYETKDYWDNEVDGVDMQWCKTITRGER